MSVSCWCFRSSREGVQHPAPRQRDTVRTPDRDWAKEESKVAAQYAINLLRPKPEGRDRTSPGEERAARLAEKTTTSRVSRSNRNPPVAENPQTPAAKVVNALRAKGDPNKRTPPLSKTKDASVSIELLPILFPGNAPASDEKHLSGYQYKTDRYETLCLPVVAKLFVLKGIVICQRFRNPFTSSHV